MMSWRGSGREDVRARLGGLHTASKRLADGSVRVYAYAVRGGPLVASGSGPSLAAANMDLERALGAPAVLQTIADFRRQTNTQARIQSTTYAFGLVGSYLGSREFAALAGSTQRAYRAYLERFRSEFGEGTVRLFEQPGIVRDLTEWRDAAFGDSPRAADLAMASIGALFKWARGRGLTSAAPTADIRKLHHSNRSDVIWTQADLDAFAKVAARPLTDAVMLAAYTGLRQGDLLALKWGAVSGVAITLRTSKRGRVAVIPLIEPARKLLAAMDRRGDGDTVLTSSRGEGWTSDGFRTSFMRARDKAKVEKHFHDLRGTAATRLKLARKLTNQEIAGILGWSKERVDDLLALYVSADVVALDMLSRMGEKRRVTNRRQTGAESGVAKAEKGE